MNANDLVSKMLETQTITFSFGKNGWGLSDEFISIGNRIKELSQTNNVYLVDAKIDTMDDVYDLTFEMHPFSKKSTAMDTPIIPYEAMEARIHELLVENERLRKEMAAVNYVKKPNL